MRRGVLGALIAVALLGGGLGAQAQVPRVQGGALVLETEAGERWRAPLPPLGRPASPLLRGDEVWVGAGPLLHAYDLEGRVRRSLLLPGPLRALDDSGGVLRVTVQRGDTLQVLSIDSGNFVERVVYPPLPEVTGALERAATAGLNSPLRPEDPAAQAAALTARLTQDPTNPFSWLHLAAAQLAQGDETGAAASVERALARPVPFFVSLRLAAGLEALGQATAAELALAQAQADYAERGYDPELPVSRAVMAAYGDPLGHYLRLREDGDAGRADLWLRHLRTVSPRFEGHAAVYESHAALLDALGRQAEAFEWRSFALELRQGTPYQLGQDAPLRLAQAAELAATVLTVALLLAALGLLWRGHGARAALRRGGTPPPSPVSTVGHGERLVLLSLLLAAALVYGAAGQSRQAGARLGADALNLGTVGGAFFDDGVSRLGLSASPDTSLLLGLAAQLDGDPTTARTRYRAADTPCARNNLGVLAELGGDPFNAQRRYREALDGDPGNLAARYNLGLSSAGPLLAFQQLHRDGPRLCYPDSAALLRAVGGARPWYALSPAPLPAWALWLGLGLLAAWLLSRPTDRRRQAVHPAWFVVPGLAFLDASWGALPLLAFAAGVVLLPLFPALGTGLALGSLLLNLAALWLLRPESRPRVRRHPQR